MADRVIVFLDYQNVYQGARSCFHGLGAPHVAGQIDPLNLGLHLTADSPYDRELKQVRVYRGLPDSSRDSRGYGACSRQLAAWRRDPRVLVTTRTLSYPKGWPTRHLSDGKPREKGIDVVLALDFVTLALDHEYDVGILFSTDTDLKPALEFVADRRRPRAEVAAWSGQTMHNKRLSIKASNLWCHWLDETAYRRVQDLTNFT